MPEPNKDLYQQKLKRIEAAIRLKKPDRVPIILEFGCFVARYAGINSGAAYTGHGFRANNSIGRAVRLSMINCGHMWPQ